MHGEPGVYRMSATMPTTVWRSGAIQSGGRGAAVVEDPAAVCQQAQWLGIHSDVSVVAKPLRLAFEAQSRSVQRFERGFNALFRLSCNDSNQRRAGVSPPDGKKFSVPPKSRASARESRESKQM